MCILEVINPKWFVIVEHRTFTVSWTKTSSTILSHLLFKKKPLKVQTNKCKQKVWWPNCFFFMRAAACSHLSISMAKRAELAEREHITLEIIIQCEICWTTASQCVSGKFRCLVVNYYTVYFCLLYSNWHGVSMDDVQFHSPGTLWSRLGQQQSFYRVQLTWPNVISKAAQLLFWLCTSKWSMHVNCAHPVKAETTLCNLFLHEVTWKKKKVTAL